MNELIIELQELYKSECCDFDRCRQIIHAIGGCTAPYVGEYRFETTALHDAINYGHYDFALNLIKGDDIDPNVRTEDAEPLIWELQYLDPDKDEKNSFKESESKLRIIIELIRRGADPNPVCGGEELLHYVRYKINEAEENYPQMLHLWAIEHMIEAHAKGESEQFWEKLNEVCITKISASDWAFQLYDDNQCECDHLIVYFQDGERFALSSYFKSIDGKNEENDFYAVRLKDDKVGIETAERDILPESGVIKLLSRYDSEEIPSSHWLDLSIDDAILRIHPVDYTLMVGIVGYDMDDYEHRKRHDLFIKRK